jgi:CubicO group peptidase (beta-lactamase class C family)
VPRALLLGCALALACADPAPTEAESERDPPAVDEPVLKDRGAGERESAAEGHVPKDSIETPGRAAAPDRRAACLASNAGAPARYARIVQAFCAEHHNLEVVGASLAIAEGGALTLVASAGRSCLEGHAVTAATRFRIGSITKLLTAALVLRLVDAGQLRLD